MCMGGKWFREWYICAEAPCSGWAMHTEGQRVLGSKSVILCWGRGKEEAIMKNLCVYSDKCFGEKHRAGDAWRQLDLFY